MATADYSNWFSSFSTSYGANGVSYAGLPGDADRPPPPAPPDDPRDRREYVKSGPRDFPWFLPYIDDQQSLSENSQMRLAYRRMLADPNVKAALKGKIGAVQGLTLKIIPANRKNPKDTELADLVQWNLTKSIKGGFPELVWSVFVHGLMDGYSINEKVWRRYDQPGNRFDGAYYVRALKPKDVGRDVIPVTDEFRNVTKIRAMRYNSGEEYSPKNFLIYRHDPLFDTPTGQSDFRGVYSRYWLLDTALKLRAKGIERFAWPIIVGEFATAQQRPALEEALSLVKQQSWLAVPQDARVQALSLAGSGDSIVQNAIQQLAEDIFLGIAGATLQARQGDVNNARGSSAEHRNTADLFIKQLAQALEALLNDVEDGLIKEICDLNMPGVSEYPTAALEAVDDKDLKARMDIMKGAFEIGLSQSRQASYEELSLTPPDPDDPDDILGSKADQEAQVAAATLMAPGGPAGEAALDQNLIDATQTRHGGQPPGGGLPPPGGQPPVPPGGGGMPPQGPEVTGPLQQQPQEMAEDETPQQQQAAYRAPSASQSRTPQPPAEPAYQSITGVPLIHPELYQILHAASRWPQHPADRGAMIDWYKDHGVPESHQGHIAEQANYLRNDQPGYTPEGKAYSPNYLAQSHGHHALDAEMVRLASALTAGGEQPGPDEQYPNAGSFVYRVLPLIDTLDPRNPAEARFLQHLDRHNFSRTLYNVLRDRPAEMAEDDAAQPRQPPRQINPELGDRAVGQNQPAQPERPQWQPPPVVEGDPRERSLHYDRNVLGTPPGPRDYNHDHEGIRDKLFQRHFEREWDRVAQNLLQQGEDLDFDNHDDVEVVDRLAYDRARSLADDPDNINAEYARERLDRLPRSLLRDQTLASLYRAVEQDPLDLHAQLAMNDWLEEHGLDRFKFYFDDDEDHPRARPFDEQGAGWRGYVRKMDEYTGDNRSGIDEPIHQGVGVDVRGRRYRIASGKHAPLPEGFDEGLSFDLDEFDEPGKPQPAARPRATPPPLPKPAAPPIPQPRPNVNAPPPIPGRAEAPRATPPPEMPYGVEQPLAQPRQTPPPLPKQGPPPLPQQQRPGDPLEQTLHAPVERAGRAVSNVAGRARDLGRRAVEGTGNVLSRVGGWLSGALDRGGKVAQGARDLGAAVNEVGQPVADVLNRGTAAAKRGFGNAIDAVAPGLLPPEESGAPGRLADPSILTPVPPPGRQAPPPLPPAAGNDQRANAAVNKIREAMNRGVMGRAGNAAQLDGYLRRADDAHLAEIARQLGVPAPQAQRSQRDAARSRAELVNAILLHATTASAFSPPRRRRVFLAAEPAERDFGKAQTQTQQANYQRQHAQEQGAQQAQRPAPEPHPEQQAVPQEGPAHPGTAAPASASMDPDAYGMLHHMAFPNSHLPPEPSPGEGEDYWAAMDPYEDLVDQYQDSRQAAGHGFADWLEDNGRPAAAAHWRELAGNRPGDQLTRAARRLLDRRFDRLLNKVILDRDFWNNGGNWQSLDPADPEHVQLEELARLLGRASAPHFGFRQRQTPPPDEQPPGEPPPPPAPPRNPGSVALPGGGWRGMDEGGVEVSAFAPGRKRRTFVVGGDTTTHMAENDAPEQSYVPQTGHGVIVHDPAGEHPLHGMTGRVASAGPQSSYVARDGGSGRAQQRVVAQGRAAGILQEGRWPEPLPNALLRRHATPEQMLQAMRNYRMWLGAAYDPRKTGADYPGVLNGDDARHYDDTHALARQVLGGDLRAHVARMAENPPNRPSKSPAAGDNVPAQPPQAINPELTPRRPAGGQQPVEQPHEQPEQPAYQAHDPLHDYVSKVNLARSHRPRDAR